MKITRIETVELRDGTVVHAGPVSEANNSCIHRIKQKQRSFVACGSSG
jgi:hypothetical protein